MTRRNTTWVGVAFVIVLLLRMKTSVGEDHPQGGGGDDGYGGYDC